jgi:AcrR family transcriptional regulator
VSVKDKILRIAIRRFAAVGFEAATMRSIASRAGVTLPTIYHYFGDKANLYLEACLATFAPRADHALAAFERSSASEEQRILGFFVDLASDLLEDEDFFKLLHREMIDQDRDGIEKLTERCWKQSFAALALAFRSIAVDRRDPAELTLASFALMLGLAEFRRNAPFLDGKFGRYYQPKALAGLVLNTTVPHINWSGLLAKTA